MAERYIPGTVWARAEKSTRATRPTLDREQIVAAAIELLDESGLDGMTIRRLGARLGVAATTMYWHVASREELLDFVFDQVLGEVRPPTLADGSKDWRSALTASYIDMRAMVERHPWFASLNGTRPMIGPNGTRWYAATIDTLTAAGCSGAVLDNSLWALSNYVVGASASIASWDEWLGQDPADLEATRRYARESIEPYPNYVNHVDNYLTVTDPQEMREGRFTFGLERLLDGIAAYLKKRRQS